MRPKRLRTRLKTTKNDDWGRRLRRLLLLPISRNNVTKRCCRCRIFSFCLYLEKIIRFLRQPYANGNRRRYLRPGARLRYAAALYATRPPHGRRRRNALCILYDTGGYNNRVVPRGGVYKRTFYTRRTHAGANIEIVFVSIHKEHFVWIAAVSVAGRVRRLRSIIHTVYIYIYTCCELKERP